MATALTKAQWYAKLKGWVPIWFQKDQTRATAILQAMAQILAARHTEMIEHLEQTFISIADAPTLDLHGDERSLTRLSGETDANYSIRIRNIINQSYCAAIKILVDQFLINGECIIIEDYNAQIFCDREVFLSRDTILLTDTILNTFTILVPKQLHTPYSFLDREYFAEREDFIGAAESNLEVFELILEAVNAAKAVGTFYRIIESLEE